MGKIDGQKHVKLIEFPPISHSVTESWEKLVESRKNERWPGEKILAWKKLLRFEPNSQLCRIQFEIFCLRRGFERAKNDKRWTYVILWKLRDWHLILAKNFVALQHLIKKNTQRPALAQKFPNHLADKLRKVPNVEFYLFIPHK
jgi:hypothetical protein